MPTRTLILIREDLAVSFWSGRVSLTEMMAAQRSYVASPRYRVGRPHLFDVSKITEPAVNAEDFHRFIDLVNTQNFGKDRPFVSIYAPTDILFGIGRQFQSITQLAGGTNTRVFRTEHEALAHVGRPETTIHALLQRPGVQDAAE